VIYSTCNVWLVALAGEDMFQSPFSWDLVGKNLLSLTFLGIFFFILTLCIEYGFWYNKLRCLMSSRSDLIDL